MIQQCGETMKENISAKTVCGYYACASIYGLDSVMKKSDFRHNYNGYGFIVRRIYNVCIFFCRCLEWLLNNLMTHQNVDLMKELGFV